MKKLKHWREPNDLSIEQVAEFTGLPVERLITLETTDEMPEADEALLLGLAYRIDPEEITGYAKVFNISPQRSGYYWGRDRSIMHHQSFAGYLGIRVNGRREHYFVPVTRSVAGRALEEFDEGDDRFITFPTLTNEWIAARTPEIADLLFLDDDADNYDALGSRSSDVVGQLRLPPSLYHALIPLLDGSDMETSGTSLLPQKLLAAAAAAGVIDIEPEIAIYSANGEKHALPAWCEGLKETAKAIWNNKPVISFDHASGMVERRFRTSNIALISIPLNELKEAVDGNNPLYQSY